MKPFNLDEYLKNPNKKVVTRDGKNVKIHCTNCVGAHPVIAEIEGLRYSFYFGKDGGCYLCPSPYDLFFATEKREGWVNVYGGLGLGTRYCKCIFDSEEEALRNSDQKAIATVKIEWEE